MVRWVKVKTSSVPFEINFAPALLGRVEIQRLRVSTDTIKYHVYLVKEKYSLRDGIGYLPDFKTRFLQPSSTSENDLNPIVDAVLGQVSRCKKASTEASAAPRRVEKPELESSEALPKHNDRRSSAKRPARGSPKQQNSRNNHSFC